MRILFLVFAILFFQSTQAQIPVQEFISALRSENYSKFKQSFIKALKIEKSIEYGNYLNREIIKSYKEVYYEIYELNSLTSFVHHIKLIVKKNKIIFYQFGFTKVAFTNSKRVLLNVSIDSGDNKRLFTKFKNDFKRIYETELNESDLWQIKIVAKVSGGLVGTGKILPAYNQIEHFVATNKRDSLLQMLRSANIETQVYGLWGFNNLKKRQELTAKELKFIAIVLAKKTRFLTGGYGCELMYRNPREFVNEYKLDELK